MPLYEYQCQDCGVRFERRQPISDDPVKICPECGGDVRRLIQPVGIIFKGSGFYVTDNRAKSSTAIPGNTKKPKNSEKSTSTTSTTSTTDTSKNSSDTSTKSE
ncbi:MAG: hypothetical protein GY832_28100 [Chloroflexi bacterium]|nr:hypothetical protein [Chloroflexota bacterium]